jgi:uncharacterized protein
MKTSLLFEFSFLCLLSGCQTFMTPTSLELPAFPESSDYYLQLASKASEKNSSTINVQKQQAIIKSVSFLKQHKPKDALKTLKIIHSTSDLSKELKMLYYVSRAEALLRTQHLAESVLFTIKLQNLTGQTQLNHTIWHELQLLPIQRLRLLQSQIKHQESIQGWLNLAIISKTVANHPIALTQQIEQWKQHYPTHPAQSLIPTNYLIESNHLFKPKQITLLLPITGPTSEAGKVIRDGFMTAFYQDVKQSSVSPKIQILDTYQHDIVKLYQQAILEGAELIIGPLTKSDVDQLANHTHASIVPTITLNYASTDRAHSTIENSNWIEFGFSFEQEAQQIAEAAWIKGVSKILMITSEDEWSQHIQKTWEHIWQQLGGQIVKELSFSSSENIPFQIAEILNINLSEQRKATLEKIFNQPIKNTVRRRQDIDGILFAGNTAEARQIQPLLRFYYAGNLPLFSLSTIYQGYPSPQKDSDLNSIYLHDIPWVLSSQTTVVQLKKQIQSLWPAHYQKYTRLYALGIDSYIIGKLFLRLRTLPQFPIHGMTGQLSLQNNGKISHQLMLAQFVKGVPRESFLSLNF